MQPKYIDIHCHTNFKVFSEDYDEVIKRALQNNTWLINVGTQLDTSKSAVKIAHEYPEGVFSAIGLHPIHTGKSYHDEEELGEGGDEFTSRGEIFNKAAYLELAKDSKTVAIGECGLDYFRAEPESIEKQKWAFIAQVELANEVGKPLMLHIRNNKENDRHDAYFDCLEILKKHSKVKGVVHFFAGNRKHAEAFIDFGFLLSFTGVLTFTHDYDEVVRNTPLDMILNDTDSPYVSPVPFRGKRNEPTYVSEITKKIAEIKGISETEASDAILANAKRIFGV